MGPRWRLKPPGLLPLWFCLFLRFELDPLVTPLAAGDFTTISPECIRSQGRKTYVVGSNDRGGGSLLDSDGTSVTVEQQLRGSDARAVSPKQRLAPCRAAADCGRQVPSGSTA
jgi:hypothetical protein